MTLIGMLHYRKTPAQVKKAFACAAVAKMEGVDFVYFSYHSVDFELEKIQGWKFIDGIWQQQEVDFPDVILNISGPKTEAQSQIRKQLKEKIPFTSFPVGTKMKVYKKIKNAKDFADYLIPSNKLKNGERVLELFNQYNKIVIKPFSGSKGRKVLFLEKIGDGEYQLTEGDHNRKLLENEILDLVNDLKNEKKYLVQPFIECKTKAGLTYDFRLHVQKNGNGEWEITLIYPRVSGSGKMISNVSSGGYRGELDIFLQEEFGEQYFNMRRTLEHFAIAFSYHMDQIYNRSFDELGIDVGVDGNQKLWIFEVNWRPGCKHREFEVAKRLIPYAIFLTNRSSN
ncbi:YheC/YheD family protein [Bacillus suaedaesalsae]|uniref:YheC/YheD family protein n=1 Tax=Bacillus suaedaesalsae TaxID=2810349 RepID=A0ABS2DIB5_9BACI|nr:YheC/YheD family protein [Bacillus suaedaesalsae]MBM6618231.1 YheC/YheD family protein [Bacillus suaedaesalsae]